MLLVGDIGGTKTHLALIEDAPQFKILKEKKYPSKEYPSLLLILKDFLSEKVSKVCLGVAGPVQNGVCQATNLAWLVDVKEISAMLHVQEVFLINDLEAMALGVLRLSPQDFYVLNKGKPQKGNKALIAAGTGLGVAGLFWDGETHSPIASEGGHMDFAPRTEGDLDLWRYLNKKFGRTSYERVVSGPGIETLYQFFSQGDLLGSRDIVEMASTQKNKASVQAMESFVSHYGSFAGSIALTFLAVNGIYLGGGIAPNILQLLHSGTFMKSFLEKGRLSPLLADIPIQVILNDKTPLIGAHARL